MKLALVMILAVIALFSAYAYVGSRIPLIIAAVLLAVLVYAFLIEIWEGDGVGESFWRLIKRLFSI